MSAAAQEASIQELREVNRLVYLKPDNGALVDKRTLKSYNFSSSSYAPGQTAQCIINSGGDAIWGPTSYLRVQFTKDDGVIGTGSLLNIFKNVRLTHRSGEVLEYIQTANLLGKIKLFYGMHRDAAEKMEEILAVEDAAQTYVRCVPLHMLLGVFGEQQQYVPPGFLAGAKLEIDLEENALALIGAGKAYSDVRMNVVLDSAQVYDSVQKQLLDEQADVSKSGLQFSYSTWFNTSGNFAADSVNFDVQQSASITQKVCATVRATANLVNAQDSFKTEATATAIQWRLGSQYFPQQALAIGTQVGDKSEAYLHSLVAWDASPLQYAGMSASGQGALAKLADWTAGKLIPAYSQTMEKSSTGLQLTGEPTNNSRILNLEMTKTAVADRVDVFLQYLRVANIMGDNVVVDR
jgi:hypothetical protein